MIRIEFTYCTIAGDVVVPTGQSGPRRAISSSFLLSGAFEASRLVGLSLITASRQKHGCNLIDFL